MKCLQPSTHPGYTDFCRGEGVVVRLREQVLEVQFLYFRVGCFLQNGPVTVLSQYSSYSTKRSSYCIVTVQFLSTRRSSYCIVTVQFLYLKRSSYCIVTVKFLYRWSINSPLPFQCKDPLMFPLSTAAASLWKS